MSILVTPRQFNHRAEFYQQLAQLTSAGAGLQMSLEQLARHPPDPAYRAPILHLVRELNQGRTFTSSLRQLGGWLPEFDIALLDAGERSGRLDACFRLLADYYADRARMAKDIINQLVYPIGLVHFAALVFIVILPFARSQFSASLLLLVAKAALALAPLYLTAALIIYAAAGRQGAVWRGIIEGWTGWIPVLGTARRQLALARCAAALEALLNAGVNIIQAWDLAGNASGSIAVSRAVAAMKPQVVAGMTPAEALRDRGFFPDLFANLYTSGEVSGKLDETLRRLYAHYHEEGTHRLHLFTQWLPRLIYLLAAGIVAYNIIKFGTGYFNQITAATNGF